MNHLLNLILVLSLGLFINTNSFDVVNNTPNESPMFALTIDLEDDTDLNSIVVCKCARANSSIFRLIGIGNKNCLASNTGSTCLTEVNANCQSVNTNCGGTNPEDEEFD